MAAARLLWGSELSDKYVSHGTQHSLTGGDLKVELYGGDKDEAAETKMAELQLIRRLENEVRQLLLDQSLSVATVTDEPYVGYPTDYLEKRRSHKGIEFLGR